jgi:hypothetical protein
MNRRSRYGDRGRPLVDPHVVDIHKNKVSALMPPHVSAFSTGQPSRRHILAAGGACALIGAGHAAASAAVEFDPALAELHRRTFDYFWQSADPDTGLHPDNWPNLWSDRQCHRRA